MNPCYPKRKELNPPNGLKEKYWMVFSTNLRMVVTGVIYPRIYLLIRRYFGTTNNGVLEGVIEKIRDVLHGQLRQKVKKKKRSGTTLIIIDSQAVKNTCNASTESKGFCFYKSTNGIKRHLAVDSLGFPFFTHCTKASVSDDVGLIEMLSDNINYFKSKPVNIPKITILQTYGYHPEKLTIELKKIYPAIMTKIRFKLSPKPSKALEEEAGTKGFCTRQS